MWRSSWSAGYLPRPRCSTDHTRDDPSARGNGGRGCSCTPRALRARQLLSGQPAPEPSPQSSSAPSTEGTSRCIGRGERTRADTLPARGWVTPSPGFRLVGEDTAQPDRKSGPLVPAHPQGAQRRWSAARAGRAECAGRRVSQLGGDDISRAVVPPAIRTRSSGSRVAVWATSPCPAGCPACLGRPTRGRGTRRHRPRGSR